MGQNYAIVVGVDYYDNLTHLKYATNDARSVCELFRELDFDAVYLFTHDADPISPGNGSPSFPAKPTYRRLKNFLDKRLDMRNDQWLGDKDNLWFFFAGHGLRYEHQDYLLVEDSNPDNPIESALAVQDLAAELRTSCAGNIILLIDACRNNGGRNGSGLSSEQHQGVITFYSCAPSQISYEIEDLHSGVFTYSLLRGLRGEVINCATVKRLASHLAVEVPDLVLKYKKCIQNPQLAVDPESKRDVILLPGREEYGDIGKLKEHALSAEIECDYEIASKYWYQVLAIEGGSSNALKAIERLAVLKDQSNRTEQQEVSSSGVQKLASSKVPSSENLRDSSPRKLSAITPTQSRRKIDYSHLELLLKLNQWNLADEETWLLILKMSYREKDGWIRPNDIEKISCHDLYDLDYLWKRASNGKFGLSIQCTYYMDCGLVRGASFNTGVWEDFGDILGWRKSGYWIEDSSIKNLTEANIGHLPAINVWVTLRGASATTAGKLMHSLFMKIMECNVIEFNNSPP